MTTPFRDIQAYTRALEADPSLVHAGGRPEESQLHRIIRSWDEIPDVMTMATSPTEWLVEGIIPRGSVTLIAGEPGSYKSWLALKMLGAVSQGGDSWNGSANQRASSTSTARIPSPWSARGWQSSKLSRSQEQESGAVGCLMHRPPLATCGCFKSRANIGLF